MFALLPAAPAFAQYRYPPRYPFGPGYARYESSLRVDVDPSNASVFVDGYLAGTVDDFDGVFQRLHLEPGQHEIVVYLQGHRSIRERLYFSPNASRKLTGRLEPLASGQPDEGPPVPLSRSETPDPRTGPPVGTPSSRRVDPPPSIQAPIPPAAAPSRFGTLSISVRPGDAEVVVDGERWASGASNDRLLIQLSEGRHVVEVSKNGFRRFSTEIQVRAGETAPLNVSLTREP